MTKQPSMAICNDLERSYRNLDLEWLFLETAGDATGSVTWEMMEDAVLTYADTSRVENTNGFFDPDYATEIHRSVESFFQNCVKHGVLEETDAGHFKMVIADPNLMVSERDGVRVELNRTYPYTVYRKRMNTSGRIDIMANGDPAIEGVTAEGALSW